MKPSFLGDVENGRPTELDTLSGTIVRLGQEHGIETPVHARVVRELSGLPKADAGAPGSAERALSLAS
jgi:2-dehydropantoate 2-reductase